MTSRRRPSFPGVATEPRAGGSRARRTGRLVLAITLALLIGVLGGTIVYLLLAGA